MNRVPTIVLGGKGLVAGELLRLIAAHPQLELAGCLSDGSPGESVAGTFPHLSSAYPDTLFQSHTQIAALLRRERAPAVFGAAPHGVSAGLIDTLLMVAEQAGNNPQVVDISADFRIKDVAEWERWYKVKHAAPELIAQAVYGLCEVNRDKIRGARLVANPGCYPTAVQLGLLPLVEAGAVDIDHLIADAKSGVSGAGRKLEQNLMYSESADNFSAYGVGGHRVSRMRPVARRPPSVFYSGVGD